KADKTLAGKANKQESNGNSEAYQNNEDKTAEIGKNLGTAKKETFQEAPKLTVERDENTESKEESKVKPKAESLKSLDGAEGTSTKSITQNSFEALGESEKIPPEKQVERAVLKAVRENKDVLVMKLTPESLGEITVKISRMGERLTVNLTALNEQTQKLLQGAESELRLALKPLGNEIVVQTGGTSAQNDLTGFLNGQRQFGGYGENNQRQQRQSYYYQREGLEMSEAPTLEKQLESVLSMYA
ncbi:MAG: flagellar hook-length control protein FliK, partial [Oscillospiraceae bacterium]